MGTRLKPVRPKDIGLAFENRKRKKDQETLIVKMKTTYMQYNTTDLVEACKAYTLHQSKKRHLEEYPNIPYQTVLNNLKPVPGTNEMKYQQINTNENRMPQSAGVPPTMPGEFEQMLFVFASLCADKSTPATIRAFHKIVRDFLIQTKATYYSKKLKKRVQYNDGSNVRGIFRGIMQRLQQDGYRTKIREGNNISSARVKAGDDTDGTLKFQNLVGYRIQELADYVFDPKTEVPVIFNLNNVANIDEFQINLCATGRNNERFILPANSKSQIITGGEKSPHVTGIPVIIGDQVVALFAIVPNATMTNKEAFDTFPVDLNPLWSGVTIMAG